MEEEHLIQVAMDVIMHAGDARDYVRKAGSKLTEKNFENVDELLELAKKELVLAHKAQTSILQNEATGEKIQMTVLFSHAQDTLMVAESEQYMMSVLYQCLKGTEK